MLSQHQYCASKAALNSLPLVAQSSLIYKMKRIRHFVVICVPSLPPQDCGYWKYKQRKGGKTFFKSSKEKQGWWNEANRKKQTLKREKSCWWERAAEEVEHDRKWGGEEKPRHRIVNEEKGLVHDFGRAWEPGSVFLSHLCAGHLTSLRFASEAPKALWPTAHME